jgi:hypothetical protein
MQIFKTRNMMAVIPAVLLLVTLSIEIGGASTPHAGIGSSLAQWRSVFGKENRFHSPLCGGNSYCFGPTVVNNYLGTVPKYFGVAFSHGKDFQYSEIFAPRTTDESVLRAIELTFSSKVVFGSAIIHQEGKGAGHATCAWFRGHTLTAKSASAGGTIRFVVEMYAYTNSVGFRFSSKNVQIAHIYSTSGAGSSC